MSWFKLTFLAAAVSAMAFAQAPVVAVGGVLDGASFTKGQAVAPGSVVSIFGGALANALQSGDTIPLSSVIGGVSVKFNDIPAGLYFVSSGQINAQIPWNVLGGGATSGTVNVVVTTPNGTSAPQAVQIAPYTAGIYTANPGGTGYAIAINTDGSLAAPAGTFAGVASHPAKVGDTIIVYANGLGAVDPPDTNGAASLDALRNTVTTPVVTIGGQKATVSFSGLTPQFPAINQLNVIVPNVPASNSVPMQIQIGNVKTPTGPIIAVQ